MHTTKIKYAAIAIAVAFILWMTSKMFFTSGQKNNGTSLQTTVGSKSDLVDTRKMEYSISSQEQASANPKSANTHQLDIGKYAEVGEFDGLIESFNSRMTQAWSIRS
jgi:hypothetical protein